MVEGFKNTEVGVIPEDWEVKSLGDIAQINMGQSPDSKFYKSYKTGLPLIQGNADLKNKKQVIRFWSSQITKTCDEGEIIMTVRAPVGAIGLSTERSCIGRGVCSLKANNIEKSFLYFSLEFKESEWKVLEQGSTFTAANSNQIKGFQIPLPPTKAEQTAIATALSDADALISSLEKLIAKKKAIRQATVMELLTGRKRLDGFHEKWINEELPNVCWFQEGPGLRNWQFTKSGIKVINVTNLVNGFLDLDRTDRHISLEEFHKMYEHFEIDENDIVVASSGNSYGKVAIVRKQDLPLLMNTSVIRFKPLKDIDYNFLLAFLKSYLFKDQIDLLTTGGAQPNFGPAHLKKIFISLPKSPEEQKAIGEILSNVDLEIVGLEIKLEKQKQLKQGMMQSLLTGKIRLV